MIPHLFITPPPHHCHHHHARLHHLPPPSHLLHLHLSKPEHHSLSPRHSFFLSLHHHP
ncbi:hypothetical protein Hanom_Chr01g00038681 [Helianthus anomalus]